MFTKKELKGHAYAPVGRVYEKKTDWGAVVFWGFIGMMILGAILN